MNIKKVLKKIQKKGLKKFICKIFTTFFHSIIAYCYKTYLLNFSEIKEDQILFYSTPSFSDNSKILYEYLIDQNDSKNYQFVWLIHREDSMPEKLYPNTVFVKADSFNYRGSSLKALKYIASSKYIFFTHSSPMKYIKKRNGQLVINLWHGCGYKDTEDHSKKIPFDKAIVPGSVFVKTKSKFWGCSEEQILPIGYPRYDLLKKTSQKAEQFIKTLKENSDKLIIWLPTFRNTGNDLYPEEEIDYVFDIPILKNVNDVDELDQFCKMHKITLCLKRHPKQVIYSCEKNIYSNIKFISNQDLVDANIELYSVFQYTDALISDYSSAAIDYLLLDKPIAFSLDDFEIYKKTRGFVFDDPLKYMPGHHLYTFSDITSFIEDIYDGVDRYASERKKIMSKVHNNDRDNYCQRVWQTVNKFNNKDLK